MKYFNIQYEDFGLPAGYNAEMFKNDIIEKVSIEKLLSEENKKIVKTKNGGEVVIYSLHNIPTDNAFFLIHSINVDSNAVSSFKDRYIQESSMHDKICMSLLDNQHMNTFANGIVYGYSNLKEFQIYSVVPFDAQTNQWSGNNYGENKPQYRSVLVNIDSFLNNTSTSSYNEIAFSTMGKVVFPSYILVADRNPNAMELKIAEEFCIPIYLYNVRENILANGNQNNRYKNIGEAFDYNTTSIDLVSLKDSKSKAVIND